MRKIVCCYQIIRGGRFSFAPFFCSIQFQESMAPCWDFVQKSIKEGVEKLTTQYKEQRI